MTVFLAGLALSQISPSEASRSYWGNALPGVAWARLDGNIAPRGPAHRTAQEMGLQGRVMWIDGTANLDAVNTPEKIAALMQKVKTVGFNTVVYDVKPIVGRTLYPSALAPQMTSWKGQHMPAGYDPVAIMGTEARRQGLGFFIAMNAFSEGHSYAKRDEKKPDSEFGEAGWGYEAAQLQSVRYDATPILALGEMQFPVAQTLNPGALSEPVSLFTRKPAATEGAFAALNARGVVTATGRLPVPDDLAFDTLVVAQGEAAIPLLAHIRTGGRFRLGSLSRFVGSAENQNQIPLMMNPHSPEIQKRALGFIDEAMTRYKPDGFLYDDRLRFGGIESDFSESTRAAFEARVGRDLSWPEDVFTFTFDRRLNRGIEPGPYYDAWMAFRAETMQKFVREARRHVKTASPTALFGIYAGSWYGDYPRVGANYASADLEAGFPFLTRAYREAGFAGDLDLLITGCYYRFGTLYEALGAGRPAGQTVEAGAVLSTRVSRDQTWTYAGIQLADYWDDPRGLETALQAAVACSQGVMVFDLSHRIDQFWPVLERAFARPAQAPHSVPGLLEQVRAERAARDRRGEKDPPFPILEGAPGAGF
ncbi:MAG: family 10 glycosylhydrolase [Fimbriimonadaceae bacterium]|nr:family 10 glycosylhydrolase [Fimbriimonadaceae bacterium]QYK55695.1 MAG: family 10 glycosylhydrolase [Fimbriimonadaceae bacterium]